MCLLAVQQLRSSRTPGIIAASAANEKGDDPARKTHLLDVAFRQSPLPLPIGTVISAPRARFAELCRKKKLMVRATIPPGDACIKRFSVTATSRLTRLVIPTKVVGQVVRTAPFG